VKVTERQLCALEQLAERQTRSDVLRHFLEGEAERLGLAADDDLARSAPASDRLKR
jgi:hypothetical protein